MRIKHGVILGFEQKRTIPRLERSVAWLQRSVPRNGSVPQKVRFASFGTCQAGLLEQESVLFRIRDRSIGSVAASLGRGKCLRSGRVGGRVLFWAMLQVHDAESKWLNVFF